MIHQLKIGFTIFLLSLCYQLNAQENKHIDHFENGKIKAIGFKNDQGIATGKWTYYRKDGSIDVELILNEEGKPQGPFAMYYSNGQLQTKGNYSGEGFYEFEGSYEDYHKNGQLQSVGTYKNNNTVGKWVTYWENGQINSLTHYTEEGVIQKNTEYYQNGQLKMDVLYNSKGDFTGNLIVYYSNGQIFTMQAFDENGNKKGTYKSYYKNGTLMEVGDYAGTDYFKKKGVWKTFYKNASLKSEITYDENGKRLGEIKRFDQQGNLIPK